MNTRIRRSTAAGITAAALLLAGCTSTNDNESTASPTTESHQGHGSNDQESSEGTMGHSMMDHPMDGGPAPAGITEASDPTYLVGSEVKLTANHMEGMDGATATIAGAFDTYTYSVNYTPVGGGEPVIDHKWVVQEELQDAGDERLEDGAAVTLLPEHMEGMEGAEATIAHSTDETVYMVDYDADGMTMTNHKWVVESEIRPAS